MTGAVSGAFAASGVGAAGQAIVGAATNIASYVATTPKEEINPVECAIEATVGGVSGFRGGSGLNAAKEVASQVSIINSNMHAVKYSWRAVRTVNTCMRRIAGKVQTQINKAINHGILWGIGHGVWSRYKKF